MVSSPKERQSQALEANAGRLDPAMLTSDFVKDAESSIQAILSRDRVTLCGILSVMLLISLTFLFLPMLLFMDLLAAIFRAFRE